MAVKKVVVAVIILIIALAAAVYYYMQMPAKPSFVEDPKEWMLPSRDGITVDVSLASRGGHLYADTLQMPDEGTAFSWEGWYEGNYFKEKYEMNGKVLMRITPTLKPGDGVPDGFIVESLKGEAPTITVFLDDDWMKKFPETKIYYGKTFQLRKDFTFTKNASEGIYYESFEDDAGRFQNGFTMQYGGVWVGVLKKDNTSTLISFT